MNHQSAVTSNLTHLVSVSEAAQVQVQALAHPGNLKILEAVNDSETLCFITFVGDPDLTHKTKLSGEFPVVAKAQFQSLMPLFKN